MRVTSQQEDKQTRENCVWIAEKRKNLRRWKVPEVSKLTYRFEKSLFQTAKGKSARHHWQRQWAWPEIDQNSVQDGFKILKHWRYWPEANLMLLEWWLKVLYAIPSIGVDVLVESLQVELKPYFSLTFFLTEQGQNLVPLKKNKATGQTSCIHSLHCEEVNSVLTKMTIMELVYLNISLLLVYREEYNICFWLTLFIKIFSHREKRRRISVDKNSTKNFIQTMYLAV